MNFDVDLMDCTVLACTMAAYCPYLVSLLKLELKPPPPQQHTPFACVLHAPLLISTLTTNCKEWLKAGWVLLQATVKKLDGNIIYTNRVKSKFRKYLGPS